MELNRKKKNSGAFKHINLPTIPDDLALSPFCRLKVIASVTMMIQISTVEIANTIFAILLGILRLNDKKKGSLCYYQICIHESHYKLKCIV